MKKIFGLVLLTICSAIVFFSCQKDFSVETESMQSASGSLWDSTGNCLPDTVVGTFYNGVTPGSDTAYVEIQVNVTQTGSYNITTEFENGFEFADSGFFSNTGLNTIRLKPIGTPILNTGTTFNVSFDSSFCSFTVNVQDSTGTGLGGQQDTTGTGGGGDPDSTSSAWQFSQGSFTFAGIIDSAIKDNSTGVATYLTLNGSTPTGDTTMSIKLVMPTSDIQPGTYTILNNSIFFSVVDASTLTILYTADGFTAGTDFTLVITSYDSATKQVKGTFSGQAKNQSGGIVPITSGSFTATVQ